MSFGSSVLARAVGMALSDAVPAAVLLDWLTSGVSEYKSYLLVQIVMQPSPGMTRWNYRCTGLTSESADAAKFLNVQTGQEMSVAQYFSVRYQKR